MVKALLAATRATTLPQKWRTIKVLCEVRTDSNKRLDIVVVTNSFLLGIENKIHASLYNPLAEYSKRLEQIADENRIPHEKIVKIVLSLRRAIPDHGFQCITYEAMFSHLKSRINRAVSGADWGWVRFLSQFITTIENLAKTEIAMDKKFVKFVREHVKDSLNFYLEIERLRRHLKQLVGKVKTEIVLPKAGFEHKRLG